MLSVGAKYAGVSRPPGYPLWTLYSWLFATLLPFSNMAWRVAVGSAVAAALACGIVALIVSYAGQRLFKDMQVFARFGSSERNLLRGVCGYAAGLILGFSGVVWDTAVVADVWSLSLLLFAGIVCMLVRWMFEPHRRKFLLAGFLLLGLLLTNSQQLVVVVPGLICFLMMVDRKLGRDAAFFVLPLMTVATAANQFGIWISFPRMLNYPLLAAFVITLAAGVLLAVKTRRVGTEWKFVLPCGLCLILGLSLYLYVPIASMTVPPANWGYPRTVEGFFNVIGVGQYERVQPTSDLNQFLSQMWLYVRVAGNEMGWPYLIVSLLPFCLLFRMSPTGRRCLSGLLVVWCSVAPLLLWELNPPPERQALELIRRYFAASYVLIAVSFGFGLLWLGAKMTEPANTSA